MTLKVYVDVLFIINFITDYMLLAVTSFFIKKKARLIQKFLAAGVGALFATAVFFLPAGNFYIVPLSVLVSLIMVSVAFGVKKGVFIFKNIAVFYLVSFAGAGAGFAALFLGNRYGYTSFAVNNGTIYANIHAYTLLTAFLFAVTVTHIACGYIKKARVKSRYLYDVTIKKDGKSITDRALFDTGNFLTDPLSQRSVLVAEWESVSALFGADTLAEAISASPGEFLYIPCRGLGGRTGIFAFCPDEIVSGEVSLNDSAYVGISETPLDSEGSFKMILPNTASIVERM